MRISEDRTYTACKKTAFTLAEVLITLGVIGVVAAMTLPTLIQNHKKHVVETRLAKFYTTINQAIQMSETVNGDKKDWEVLGLGFEVDDNGNPDRTKPLARPWFEKYLQPYLKYSRYEIYSINTNVYFDDGSLLTIQGYSWSFYPDATKFKKLTDENGYQIAEDKSVSGRDYFSFLFAPNSSAIQCQHHYNKGVEPYLYEWDGTLDGANGLKTSQHFGCKEELPPNGRAYCTALIMLNGWKIPKDYPLKF